MTTASRCLLVVGPALMLVGALLLAVSAGPGPSATDSLSRAQGPQRRQEPVVLGPPPTPAEPARVRLPTISADLRVEPSPVQGGFFVVPWAALGHHAGTPTPGEPGNAVLVGHALHLPLKRLAVGDPVELVGPDGRAAPWHVATTALASADDERFIDPDPGGPVRMTLYTCAGAYDWRTGLYSQRLVVVALPGR